MSRFETIALGSIFLIGAGALLLEKAGADVAKIVATSIGCLLIALIVVGLFMRRRAKRRRAMQAQKAMEAAEQFLPENLRQG